MKVFIMPNLSRKTRCPVQQKPLERLHALAVDVLLDVKIKSTFSSFDYVRFADFREALKMCDVVIAIGGDGTILHTAKYAMQENKPVFGINAGRLGFLAGLEATELDRLADLAAGRYTIDRRMMLKITRQSANGMADIMYALNDAVISKGGLAKIVDLEVDCGGEKVISHRADGIIFSTPTGSTAYSLSAGGPVIDPAIDCISMTPICSHSMLSRSIIFSDDKVLSVRAKVDEEHETFLSVDGEQGLRLESGDSVLVEKSEIFVRFLRLVDKPFYEILNEKILEKMND